MAHSRTNYTDGRKTVPNTEDELVEALAQQWPDDLVQEADSVILCEELEERGYTVIGGEDAKAYTYFLGRRDDESTLEDVFMDYHRKHHEPGRIDMCPEEPCCAMTNRSWVREWGPAALEVRS